MLFPKYILNISELTLPTIAYCNQIQIITNNPNKLSTILFLHSNLYYKSLVDLFGVDYLNKNLRFQIVYQFISFIYTRRLIIKTWTDETTPVETITSIYPSANWYERECWDLYGVLFKNHPDLRRILTDYGFQGHPFRKDFPLSGYTELRYDERYQRISYEPVRSVQEYRIFDTLTPWEYFHNK